MFLENDHENIWGDENCEVMYIIGRLFGVYILEERIGKRDW